MTSEQDNDLLVLAFKDLIVPAWADTVRDLSDTTEEVKINHICGYRISDKRLGQMLRAVKAMNV